MSPFSAVQTVPRTIGSFANMVDGLTDGSVPFEVHVQPIVDLRRGVVAGYEALSRFGQDVGLPPDRVLALADALGKRLELEVVMARKALALRDKLPPNCFLSVNVSPELMLSPVFEQLYSDFGSFAAIVVEITEQEAISDYGAMRRQVERIRASGGCVAVDDTGSGYSSLKHVMELRPDFIKLDRLFVNACHLEAAKRAMIELLGDTADRLNAWIVAEGVENVSELDELLRLKVPLGQGWHLGRPEPMMTQIDPQKGRYLRSKVAEIAHSRSVFPYTELCAAAASEEQAETMLRCQPGLTAITIVDRWDRPVALIERDSVRGVRHLRNVMRVQMSSGPDEVLRRAMTRPAGEHFDPIAVVNEQGELQGILHIDRLTRGVLDEKAQENADTTVVAQRYSPERIHAHTPRRVV